MASIYHYTDLNALFSIVHNKELWASDTEFLNDATEIKHAIKMLLNKVDPANKYDSVNSDLFESLEILKDALARKYLRLPSIPANIHKKLGLESVPQIISFSTEADSLYMWRNYARENGVCIEFDEDKLLLEPKEPEPYRFGITPVVEEVIYGDVFPDSLFLQIQNSLKSIKDLAELENYVFFELTHLLAKVKHGAFSLENEKRLVLRTTSCLLTQNIRVGAQHAVPYIVFPFSLDSIISITVGPSPFKRRNIIALDRWKNTPRGLTAHIDIRESAIPYV